MRYQGHCYECGHYAPPLADELFPRCAKCGSSNFELVDSGQFIRDSILKTHEEQRGEILDYLHQRVLHIAFTRIPKLEADADDVTEELDKLCEEHPEVAEHDRRFTGGLWRGRGWEKTGETRLSRIPRRHARPIPVWRYVGA